MNRLTVAGGASVSTPQLWLGAGSLVAPTALFNSDSNRVVIEGSNSTLNAAGALLVGGYGRFNRLEIRGGARVTDAEAIVGFSSSCRSNAVLVTGPGSAWLNAGRLTVGSNGMSSALTIADGARVVNGDGFLGISGVDFYGGSICFGVVDSLSQVAVSGPQSLWENRGTLFVGAGASGNRLAVTEGGTVLANALVVGYARLARSNACPPATNYVLIHGGCLAVTNDSASAVLEPRYGALVLQSGVVVADRLLATNDANLSLVFSGGTLRIREGFMAAPAPAFSPHFMGDGTHSATLVLEHGTFEVGTGLIMAPETVMAGEGIIRAVPFTVRGTIAPGDGLSTGSGRGGPGRLSLLGNQFAMDAFSSLALDIAGTEPGVTHDQFVTDSALFDGYLDIRLRGGFVPQASDVFEVVKFNINVNNGTFEKSLTPQQRVFTVDRLGSFLLQRSSTNFVLTDYRAADTDGDGIEDAWATNAFGHTPLTAAERAADADGDGASNADEFKAGTDPNERSSVFRVAWVELSPRVLEWKRVRGKVYRVWYSEDLAAWHEVADPTFASLGDSCRWTDDGKGTGGAGTATKFYRVSVE